MGKRKIEASKKELRKTWDRFNTSQNLELLLNSLRSCLGKDIDDFLYISTHAPFVSKEIKSLAPKSKVLEAGCGLGHWVFWISEQGYKTIGIDISKKAIILAKKYAKKNKIDTCSFLNADVRSIPFRDNYFDYIFSFGVVEHFKNPTTLISEFHRVLKPGGKVFISVPNFYSLHTLKRPIIKMLGLWRVGYERSFTQSGLKNLVKFSNFKVCKCGLMPGEEFFGCWPSYIPIIGKHLTKKLRKLSLFLEKNQKMIGFWLYIVAKK